MSDRAWHEFACTKCPTFFRLHLDMEEDREILMKCPKCGREHQRYIYQGQITDKVAGRPDRHGKSKDTTEVHIIEVPLSACSDKPMLAHLEAKGMLGSLWARMGGNR